jgi:hypothetical protein
MSGADFKGGLKTGLADAEVEVGASPSGVKGSVDVTVQPEVRDVLAAASGMALAALTGPWGPALLVAAGAGLYFWRKHKAKTSGTP